MGRMGFMGSMRVITELNEGRASLHRWGLGVFLIGFMIHWSPVIAMQDATEEKKPDPYSAMKTVAEASEYQATSNEAEVEEFVKQLDQLSPRARLETIGYTVEGRALHALVVGQAGKLDLPVSTSDPRLVVLLLGNIHSGECDGKEALLAMARDLLSGALPGWDSKLLLIFVPNYNADGNQRVGLLHRPGQDGPVRGMGVRENAQNLDLNRDFVKLESPEARALIRTIDAYRVDALIDMHTTNGSLHRYPLTYDVPHNPAAPAELLQWLRKDFLPMTSSMMKEKGIDTFYYGNFDADHRKWETYGHEPRYSTDYMGLRGRIGILSESYSYATYKERVEAGYHFATSCLNVLAQHTQEIDKMLERADARLSAMTPSKPKIALSAELFGDPEPVDVLGYAFAETQRNESSEGNASRKFPSPADKGRRNELLQHTYRVQLWNQFRGTKQVEPPSAYFLPDELAWAVDRLKMHGVQVERLQDLSTLNPMEVNAYEIGEVSKTGFQGLTLTKLVVKEAASVSPKELGSGYLIRTSQPLGVMVTYLLEPNSDENLAAWGFMDGFLEKGKAYPVYRVEEIKSSKRVTPISREEKIRSEPLTLSNLYEPGKIIAWGGPSVNPIRWLHGSSEYLMERSGNWFAVDAATGSMRPFDRLRRLSTSLGKLEAFSDESKRREVAKMEAFIEDYTYALISHKNDIYLYDASTEVNRQLTHTPDQEKSLAELNRQGTHVAYVHKNNLYVVDCQSTEVRQWTTDGNEEIYNGILDWVYQEEIYGRGNFKGFWWSPDGKKLAFLKLNEKPVLRYQVGDSISFAQKIEETRYPKAGAPMPEVQLYVADIARKEIVEGNCDAFPVDDRLICRVDWTPDSASCVAQIQNRIQSQLDLVKFDPLNGKRKAILQEKGTAWIDVLGQPRWLMDGDFLWMSDLPAGRRHLYLVSANGDKRTALTQGDWDVKEWVGMNLTGTKAWVLGTFEDPTGMQLIEVDVANRSWKRITKESGTHRVVMHEAGDYFCDVFNSPEQPPRVEIRNASGNLLRVVGAPLLDRYRTLAIDPPKMFTIEARDGHPLQSMLILPPNHDPKKKLPVLIHVYAGPANPTVRNQWQSGNYWWHQHLAQQGIAVLLCDNRSSRGFGVADTWKAYKDLGRIELQDLEDAVAYLKTQTWADTERLGIWGWSYGGYFTSFAMTHSKLFRAGIAGAPVTDWRNYDSIYTERYMGLPSENVKGYQSSSVVEAASQLHGRLLILHGEQDDNVHMSNTLQLAYALQNANKPFDMMVYPKNRHAVLDPAQRYHMYQTMTDFLLKNLK